MDEEDRAIRTDRERPAVWADAAEWGPFLQRWSEEWIGAQNAESAEGQDRNARTAEIVRDGRLGFDPAGDAEIAAAEKRLGRRLPPSLRDFLLVTDGWRQAGEFIYLLAGASELAWLADTDSAGWIEAYGELMVDCPAEEEGDAEGDAAGRTAGGVLARSLRISLDGDAAVMFLDPEDVDEHGEWAGYWLASWSGEGPERHSSFRELMRSQYASFHSLCRPAGETREHWDSQVKCARASALRGETEPALKILEEAAEFGRDRADLLRFQLLVLARGRYEASWDWGMCFHDNPVAPVEDPLFRSELFPLLFSGARSTHREEPFEVRQLRERGGASVGALLDEYRTRVSDPSFRVTFGNPEFDSAVWRIVDRLVADPAFRGRYAPDPARSTARWPFADGEKAREDRLRAAEGVWPELRDSVRLWRPVSEDHIAPVILLAHPVLAEILTPERGRELLSIPRG